MTYTPTNLFLLTSIILFVISFLLPDRAIDLQLHDTYFVIAFSHPTQGLGLLSGITALIYFVMIRIGRPIPNTLGYLQYGFFFIGILATVCFLIIAAFYIPERTYYPFNSGYSDNLSICLGLFLLSLLAGLLTFFIGILIAILR